MDLKNSKITIAKTQEEKTAIFARIDNTEISDNQLYFIDIDGCLIEQADYMYLENIVADIEDEESTVIWMVIEEE